MAVLDKLNVGIAGVAGRGGAFVPWLEPAGARLHAVCDVAPDPLEHYKSVVGDEIYTDFGRMLESSGLDAVIVATPMQFHVDQSILALERGIHVLSEVPAAVSVDECRKLVKASTASRALYMMGENCNFMKPNVLVRELVRHGLFGELFYAEGEYLHELRQYIEKTPWRLHWQSGIPGITYGTHNLGPILQWMDGDRITRVCCENTGSHHKDPRGKPYAQDAAVMLAKTAKGALIKIRGDLVSDRPDTALTYMLQGTDGVYESGRGDSRKGLIWLRQLGEKIEWHDFDAMMNDAKLGGRYLPDAFRDAEGERAGHGGGDYFELVEFVSATRGEGPCTVGVHEAMDMTLPGLVSQESVASGGGWLDVPDSRDWVGLHRDMGIDYPAPGMR